MELIGLVTGTIAAYLTMAFLGLVSLVAPTFSDRMLENIRKWSETE